MDESWEKLRQEITGLGERRDGTDREDPKAGAPAQEFPIFGKRKRGRPRKDDPTAPSNQTGSARQGKAPLQPRFQPPNRALRPYGFAVGRVPKTGTSPGTEALKIFGKAWDTHEEVAAVLGCDPDPTAGVKRFVNALLDPEMASLNVQQVAHKVKVPIAEIFLSYARGLKAVGHAEVQKLVIQTMAEGILPVVQSLLQQGSPQDMACPECKGTGRIEKAKCMACDATGTIKIIPRFWPFAQKYIYEMAGLMGRQQGLMIQQNTNVAPKVGIQVNAGDLLGKLISSSDSVVNALPVTTAVEVTSGHSKDVHQVLSGEGNSRVQEEPKRVPAVLQATEGSVLPEGEG